MKNIKTYVFLIIVIALLVAVYVDYSNQLAKDRQQLAVQEQLLDISKISVSSDKNSYEISRANIVWNVSVDNQFYLADSSKVSSLIARAMALKVEPVKMSEAETLQYASGRVEVEGLRVTQWSVSSTATVDGGSFLKSSEDKTYYSDDNWKFLFIKEASSFVDRYPLKFKISEVRSLKFNQFELVKKDNSQWWSAGKVVDAQRVNAYLDGLYQLKSEKVIFSKNKSISRSKDIFKLQVKLKSDKTIVLDVWRVDNKYIASSTARKVLFQLSDKDIKNMQWKAEDFYVKEGEKK